MKQMAVWALLFAFLMPRPVLADDAWDLIEKGQRRVSHGNLQGALALFKQALEIDPRNGTAMNAAAQVASFLELHAESIFYYTGYLYLEAEVMGDADKVRAAIDKELRGLSEKGTFKVTVEPPEAEILINGLPMGKGSVNLPVAPATPLEVSVKIEDYHPYKETFILNDGETREVPVNLRKIIYHGKVKLKILPKEEVKIYVDTKYVGTSLKEVEAIEGKRLLCFKKEGFDRWWRYINVPRNESTDLEVVLRGQSRPEGSCTVWPESEGY